MLGEGKVMGNTMLQFKEVAKSISDMEEKKKMLRSRFEESTDELAECFHWIMEAELANEKYVNLSNYTCPELYAKELKGMGFLVEERRSSLGVLCGYDIRWE